MSARTKKAEPKKTAVKIAPAKGRPMLSWVGKKPLTSLPAFPAQWIETFDPAGSLAQKPTQPEKWKDWPTAYPKGGLLFHGDNKEVLAHLLANGFRGRVNLIYIDPPFDSGADYVRKVALRGNTSPTKLDGESYTLGEQIQYTDIWTNDNYLQFMYERVLLLKELLSEDGSILIHCDDVKNFQLRMILEEIFPGGFRNEIIWKRSTSTGLAQKRCGTLHDTIYWFSKSADYTFNMQYHAYEEEYLERAVKDKDGRMYIPIPTGNPGPRPNLYYQYKGYWPHPNGYKWTKEKMEDFDKQGKLIFPKEKDGRIQLKQFLDDMEGVKLQDLWIDIPAVNPVAQERIGYPTQKPEALLERIINMLTGPGGIVLDGFMGSGTTLVSAQKLGRRWIGCDINKGAIQTTAKRLQNAIHVQLGELEKPIVSSYTAWRVNDYDLAIQHNEAVKLACEHVGVQRSRTDSYFDGTLGKNLVKITPFDHPLSPLDLEELRRELEARKEENRDITLVCLGMELAAKAAVEDWNRLRKGREAMNRIEVIELRTDPKYGPFLRHQPATAQVKIERKKDKLSVVIEDFISPSIVERLRQQSGVLKPKIDDWRAMVDCVMIDSVYDGKTFNVALSDIPEKKADLVKGAYELPASPKPTKVAVKIIDMLGEEALITKEV